MSRVRVRIHALWKSARNATFRDGFAGVGNGVGLARLAPDATESTGVLSFVIVRNQYGG